MALPFIGPLISAGASLLGGLLGKSSQEKANEQNIALQKEFAQNSIQWKAADALKAGIHPLYAMGAQTTSFSPTLVGDTALPTALGNMGQDISRAIDVTRTRDDRMGAVGKTMQDLTLIRMGLENELLASQIAKVRQAGGNPAFPGTPGFIPGQGTNVVLGGADVKANPNWSDAADIQNRYGEPAEWAYFPFVAGADVASNVGSWLRKKFPAGARQPGDAW